MCFFRLVAARLAGRGEHAYQPEPADLDPETRRRLDAEQEAREQGVALLLEPGNEWAGEVFEMYLDRKDWAMGLRPGDLPPPMESAFRAIRQGSDGRLGNPPLL